MQKNRLIWRKLFELPALPTLMIAAAAAVLLTCTLRTDAHLEETDQE